MIPNAITVADGALVEPNAPPARGRRSILIIQVEIELTTLVGFFVR